MVADRAAPGEAEAAFSRGLARHDVQIVEYLDVIAEEANRYQDYIPRAAGCQVADHVVDVRTQPWDATVAAGALPGDGTALGAELPRHGSRRLLDLLPVAAALGHPNRNGVGGENQ